MQGHFFISYSRADGADFALQLADALKAGPPRYRTWLDERELQPGREDWDDQLVEAIQTCRGLLFVMSRDSVRVGSGCKDEWVWALKYRKPVIPLRLHADADLPFRLGSRQFVDFSQEFDTGLAQLRRGFERSTTPEGVLQELRVRLADAERELPRANQSQQPRIATEIEQLRAQIDDQRLVVDDPRSAVEQTEARIASALERERQPDRPPAISRRIKFVNQPPMTAPGHFQDRHVETSLIADFLREDGLRLLTVIGRGGVGKTAMVCRLLKSLEAGRLPDDLGELSVDGIVYLSPVGTHNVGFLNLFSDLCRLLPDEVAESLLTRYRDPHATPDALIRAMLEAFPSGRNIVLLDNFEDQLDPETLAVNDHELDEALQALVTGPAHGVKVIITSRIPPRELLLKQPAVVRRLDLDEGLEHPYAEEILRAMDPSGDLGLRTATDDELAQARQRTRGFPRALEALAAILSADRDTTLPELLANAERMPENVVEALVGEAFNRLDPPAQQVMQALAVYITPVPPVAVDVLLQPYQPAIDSARVLGRLVNMLFVRRDAGRYYLHQVDRDYALRRVPAGEPADRELHPPPFSAYALRTRGADYFEQIRTPRETWHTLDDLAPQLAEFELRVAGGDNDTAAAVLFGIDDDYLRLWGHYRLLIAMHERLHGTLTAPEDEALSNVHVADTLYVLGEVDGATERYRLALAIYEELGDRGGEAVALGNLGNCAYDEGSFRHAIELYDQSLVVAREIGDQYLEGGVLANLGDSYAAVGELDRATELFEEALDIDRGNGRREAESMDLRGLAGRLAELGQTPKAAELFDEALSIARELGARRSEEFALRGAANVQCDLGAWEGARRFGEEGVRIADEIGVTEGRVESRLALAKAYLHSGDVASARETAESARPLAFGVIVPRVLVVLGIAATRQGDAAAARQAFRDTQESAAGLIALTPDNYDTLDMKALALCGLALVDDADHVDAAIAAFGAARDVTSAEGIVQRVLRLVDALAPCDEAGVLAQARLAAAGRAE